MIHKPMFAVITAAMCFACGWICCACASDQSANSGETTAPAVGGVKRALIVCGLSGDADHHTLFAGTVGKLHEGLAKHQGFAASNIQVLFGDDPQEDDSELIRSSARSTSAELQKTIDDLRQASKPEDTLWVIVLGHSHFDGRHSWLNLPGPDIQQDEFGKLFADLPSREQVFLITSPTSGMFIKPLVAKGRVVISATEDALETNETDFPHVLARVLSAPPAAKEFDVDQDGTVTLLDLYLTVCRNVAQQYLDGELLSTEHALLDDNGDGRGTEIQIDFLTVDQGGRARPNKTSVVTIRPDSDGGLSKTIAITPGPEAAPQETGDPK
ncbi:MAG: caspase family protein [Planctomycetes bacterium]|nr:caspase family protein [Planctomycetota bacterium]